MDVELTVRNYRCFGNEPATLHIRDGFTALIGTNNAGKSSLLRLPYELRQFFQVFSAWSAPIATALDDQANQAHWVPMISPGERIDRAGASSGPEIEFVIRDGPKGPFQAAGDLLKIRFSLSNGTVTRAHVYRDGDPNRASGGLNRLIIGNASMLDPFFAVMNELRETVYIGPFRNAINIGAQESYYDISTGDAFVRSFAEFKSGGNPAQNEAVFQMVQEVRRIFDFESLDINATPDQKSLQLFVDGRSYRLSEQGSGLAHFVVTLVNVLVRRPSFLLIDEPELNLHASLQLDFLETLARYSKRGIIFATHSLGLARTAADCIYTVVRNSNGSSQVRNYESDKQLVTLLGQLSYSSQPDLGFEQVLLVEGRTELRALMQLLRLYRKEHKVLMLPLHGDDMINGTVGQELAEIKRVGKKISYLIDSERTDNGQALSSKRQGFVDLASEMQIPGHVLERRALENYFTQDAIDRALGGSFSALGPFEKKGRGQGWSKVENWRIAAQMKLADVDPTDLGNFLRAL